MCKVSLKDNPRKQNFPEGLVVSGSNILQTSTQKVGWVSLDRLPECLSPGLSSFLYPRFWIMGTWDLPHGVTEEIKLGGCNYRALSALFLGA